VGRPDDGTDTTGFFNTEYFVDLKPKEQWRPIFHDDKEALIGAMNRELEKIPGVIWNFSQPIADNMEEAVSGVKGQLALKIYGNDLRTLEAKGDQIQGERRYDLVMRYPEPYRNSREAIERIRLTSPSGERVSLAQLANVQTIDGANEIYREGNTRYVAIK
jgi:Cu/Ag efflux pump CusA